MKKRVLFVLLVYVFASGSPLQAGEQPTSTQADPTQVQHINSTVQDLAGAYFMVFRQKSRGNYEQLVYPPLRELLPQSTDLSADAAFNRLLQLPAPDAPDTDGRNNMGIATIPIEDIVKFNILDNTLVSDPYVFSFSHQPDGLMMLQVQKDGEQVPWDQFFVKQHTDGAWYLVLPTGIKLTPLTDGLATSDRQIEEALRSTDFDDWVVENRFFETMGRCAGYFKVLEENATTDTERARYASLTERYFLAGTTAMMMSARRLNLSRENSAMLSAVSLEKQHAMQYLLERESTESTMPLLQPFFSTCDATPEIAAALERALLRNAGETSE